MAFWQGKERNALFGTSHGTTEQEFSPCLMLPAEWLSWLKDPKLLEVSGFPKALNTSW